MPFSRSSEKRLKALVLFYIAGVVAIGAEITANISHYEPQSQKAIWEWFVLLEVTALLLLLSIVAVYSRISIEKKFSDFVTEMMETLASGVLHFDERGDIQTFNRAAAYMVPELASRRDRFCTYKNFLAYVYDHSLDIPDQSRLYADVDKVEGASRLLFREIIRANADKIILVQLYQRNNSEIIAILTDISLLKRHIDEMALLNEENKIMIRAIEAAGYGLVVAQAVDKDAPVIYANENFTSLLDMPADRIVEKSFYDIFEDNFDDQLDIVRAAIQTARSKGKAHNVWLKMRRDKNTVLWYCFNILFFTDTSEKEFFVCFVSEQTQSRLSQARIHQSQKLEAVSQLAGGIAHDFNNILSVVDGYAKLLRRGLDRGEDITPFLEQIHRSVKRGSEITGRLLIFGQKKIQQKPRIDVSECIRDFETLLIPIMPGQVRLIASIHEDSCYVDATADSIAQILLSLVSNAGDAMKDGGDLIISVAEATRPQMLASQKSLVPGQRYVCIQVVDSGAGIDPENLDRVYEPFYTTKDPAKNSGLGLSLVYGLVKEIGGTIDIKSTLGIGTSVTILIPLQPDPHTIIFGQGPRGADKENLSRLVGKKILIVDDTEEVLQMESELLEASGLQAITAANAAEALDICENYKGRIDFALIDVTLPGMGGIELGNIFAARRPETKIVLISAYPQSELPASAADTNIVLAKPLVFEKLEEILTKSLDGKNGPVPEGRWASAGER